MSYSSRDRVIAAFEHEIPDRVPAWFGSSSEFLIKAKTQLGLDDENLLIRLGDDFRRVSANDTNYKNTRTPFGVERHGMGYGQPTSHPLTEASIKEIIEYKWPDPIFVDVSKIKSDALKYNREYAILGGAWAPFWHDAIDLLGMENLYLKMYDDPELVDTLLQKIVDYYIEINQMIFNEAEGEIDILFIGNDFGSQTGPLLGEALFKRFMIPHLKHLVDLGHDYNVKVMMHCCGGIAELIPSLIEIGLDGLHAVQSTCCGMDLKTLKSTFGDKILFNGAIDSHHVLIDGNVDLVREKTREVLNIMMPGGGYVAGASHDSILEETPVENVVAMFDAIKEFGIY